MKPAAAVLFVVLMLLAFDGKAQTIAESITLGQEPCDLQNVLARVKEEYRSIFKSGVGVWFDRKRYALCWARTEGRVLVIWEDGTIREFPSIFFGTGV